MANSDYSEKFLKAVNWTIDQHEGGLADTKGDHGGLTKYGISKAAHPDVDIANLTRDQAIEIYWNEYWQPSRYEEIQDLKLAGKVFDEAVNCGSIQANKLLQRAVQRVGGDAVHIAVDGWIGPVTLAVVNEHAGDYLLCAFENECIRFHLGIHQNQFLPAWCRRDLDESI
jgi:lysozyme family protein